MKLDLNRQEINLLKEKAEQYRLQTGDNYSIFHIMSILTNKYEDNLESDLNEVMETKFREYQEGAARKGKKK